MPAVGTVIAEGVVCADQCLAVKKRIDILAYLKSTAFFGMAGLLMYGAVQVLDQRARSQSPGSCWKLSWEEASTASCLCFICTIPKTNS